MSTHMICSGWKCRFVCRREERLSAPDPFFPGGTIYACPECLEIGTMRNCCDEPGCFEEADCGWPSPAGYRWTCGKHMQK